MSSQVKPTEVRALGWYAVRWVNVTDWFKLHSRKGGRIKNVKEAAQLAAADSSSEAKKLKAVAQKSHSILAKAKAVFPFNLFPDLLNIDRQKLTIVYRQFFGIENTVSVPIENIKNIQAHVGPFFGSLIITSDHFVNNTQSINYLTRHDALRIQKLVQGIMVAIREKIDISEIETKELRKLLIDLGEGHTDKLKN